MWSHTKTRILCDLYVRCKIEGTCVDKWKCHVYNISLSLSLALSLSLSLSLALSLSLSVYIDNKSFEIV